MVASAALKVRASAMTCLLAAAAIVITSSRVYADDAKSSGDSDEPAVINVETRPNPLRKSNTPKTRESAPTFPFDDAAPPPPYQTRPRSSSVVPAEYRQPNIFDQVPAHGASRMASNEIVQGVPNPSDSYAKSVTPPADDSNCDSSGNPNYSGALSMKHGLQALPGSGTPTVYQPEHYPRFIGLGEPLLGTSWQNRPFHVDFFAGDMIGDDAVDGVIGQEAGFFTGTRLGWDYDYYWGVETRLGLSWMSLFDRQNPQNNIGTGNIIVWDMSLLYYPWGDSRWRPFALLGTGIQQLDSYGSSPAVYSGTLFEVPFGGGLKYRFNEWLTFRVDVIDNLAFGTGSLDTMHNVSFSGGVEYHFGGHRRTYWPWNPNPKH